MDNFRKSSNPEPLGQFKPNLIHSIPMGLIEFMCMQLEDRAPLQEGDNNKITSFNDHFLL